MPLTKSKSKKAFSHNVEAEMRAGKPQKQAVAIAYAVKRKAHKAGGGSLNPEHYDSDVDYYAARKKVGVTPRPKGYTKEDRDAIISGSWLKEQHAKEKTKEEAYYAKHAKSNEEYKAKMKDFVNENRKKAGLEPLKKGGAVKKHHSW